MVKGNPYLLSQNLAFEIIRTKESQTICNYARIYFPQIYGSEEYRKHQPFLYKIRDLIQKHDDVQLINGKLTYRSFINDSDIPHILVDSKSWVHKQEVACLFENSLSWFEIADSIRISYQSRSEIFDQRNIDTKFPEYKYTNLGIFNIGTDYNLSSFTDAIEMGMF
jgi:hypothetical protein